MTIRVLLADDQEMVRRGMRRILEAQTDIEVVGEAVDGVDALAAARRLRPDVALVDVRMPRMDGLEVTRTLQATSAELPVKVVVVTTFDLDEYVYPALRYGAVGFLLKRSGPALLVEAVRAAVAGDSLISPSVTVRLLKHVTGERRTAPPATGAPRLPSPSAELPPMVEKLTKREIEIAAKVAEGLTNVDIADAMFITPGTVKTHVASVQRKLGVRNRVGIAVRAWEMGYATGALGGPA
ncbi:response regulator [Streptomyces sp. NPDC004111]|uniref:response regulator n=1 Tax=Streptomyces sp. NPDC004111 TaxID=3364690 RepID=UPI00369056D2